MFRRKGQNRNFGWTYNKMYMLAASSVASVVAVRGDSGVRGSSFKTRDALSPWAGRKFLTIFRTNCE